MAAALSVKFTRVQQIKYHADRERVSHLWRAILKCGPQSLMQEISAQI